MIRRASSFAIFVLALLTATARAQTPEDPTPEKPLPDLSAMMHLVEANERKSEKVRQDYIYNEINTFDERDSHDAIKKTESRDQEVFWLNGVPVARTLKKNGKPLTADEAKKEDERIDEVVKKAKERRDKKDAKGKETDPRGNDEITFARILELGEFSNERREIINGRPTIIVDYQGNPKAKTHNPGEAVFKELAGTVWIDEDDHTLQHLEGHFDHDFKLAGGLAVSVRKGTWFRAKFVKINGEVWLPEVLEGDGHARYLLFFSLNGHFQLHASNYRKFKASSTILPGVTTVDPAPPTEPPPIPPNF